MGLYCLTSASRKIPNLNPQKLPTVHNYNQKCMERDGNERMKKARNENETRGIIFNKIQIKVKYVGIILHKKSTFTKHLQIQTSNSTSKKTDKKLINSKNKVNLKNTIKIVKIIFLLALTYGIKI